MIQASITQTTKPRKNRRGRIESFTLKTLSGHKWEGQIYLPYSYSENRAKPYPILYRTGSSLDGAMMATKDSVGPLIPAILDNLLVWRKAEPFLVVFFDEGLVNSWKEEGDSSEDMVQRELLHLFAYIESHYYACPTSEGRAAQGPLASLAKSFSPESFDTLVFPGQASQEEALSRFISLAESLFHSQEGNMGKREASDETVEEASDKAAEENTKEAAFYLSFSPGYTILPDENSPTGFTGVFVYQEEDYYEGLSGDVAQVDLFSNSLLLFSYESMKRESPLDPRKAYTPDQYRKGLFPAGGDTSTSLFPAQKINYYAPMTRFAPKRWGVQIPVFSGAYDYNFHLFDSEGNEATGKQGYLHDPSNPPLQNATGDVDRSSMFYVPYKKETMGDGPFADRSLFLPRQDQQKGTLRFDMYDSRNGTRDLGIYLPYGYDPKREEPYRVLYLSHGQQLERNGTEMRYMAECAVVNTMDNLQENFLVVTMNNKDLDWEEDKIWEEVENIIRYMEQHYHVGKSPKDRAFAGFSMGGFTTERIYLAHPDDFAYFGIWSFGSSSLVRELSSERKRDLAQKPCRVNLGAGDWDYLLHGPMGCRELYETLTELGVKTSWEVVPASHDWLCWQLLFAHAAQTFFWKDV